MVKVEEEDIVDQVRKEVEKELGIGGEKGNTAPVRGPKDSRPPQPQFINATRLRFNNINNEVYRQYLYPNGANITINLPLKLSIDSRNAHRVFDSSGLSYFIPPSWIGIVSKAKPGAPNFT